MPTSLVTAGAGKTTFLKYIAMQAAEPKKRLIDKVPIFISLKQWSDLVSLFRFLVTLTRNFITQLRFLITTWRNLVTLSRLLVTVL